jgi:hypothetical protein
MSIKIKPKSEVGKKLEVAQEYKATFRAKASWEKW